MGESKEVCEEIISTILQFPVKVLRVVPQNTIANIQGRGVRLDAFKEGRMYYKINRVIESSGTVVYNGMSEYYVNAAVKDRSTENMAKIADLMELFVESDKYDYEKFPKTSERKNQFKNTEEGVMAMSNKIQNLLDESEEKGRREGRQEGRREGRQETIIASIKNLMSNLKLTLEQAMDALDIPQADRATYAGLVGRKNETAY